ncbi:di-trans,poly-cis-decaprenylcistransferase [Nitratifractor sp.]
MSNRLRHLAIIMDGNGRWAKERGLRRTKGHEAGVDTVRRITEYCATHPEIETLTLYAFSTENWKRPKLEVDYLMHLLRKYLKEEQPRYMEHGIRFEVIGDLSPFSDRLREVIEETRQRTRSNRELTQILALNYGGRDEIVRSVRRLLAVGEEPSEQSISAHLDTPYSDVDLLIRTSGEQRLSNFLLWQLSYTELAFTDSYWPDFSVDELRSIIEQFRKRERKFGGI